MKSDNRNVIYETFEDGHTIKKIKYLDKNYKLSRTDGPALVEFGDKHKLVRQVFAVDSRVVSEDEFKEKYGTMRYAWDGRHVNEKVLRTPLPFILRAIIKRLQEHTNKTYKTTQELLNRLIA